ncbi:hypothetical protein [Streptomyces sp. NPDC055036]
MLSGTDRQLRTGPPTADPSAGSRTGHASRGVFDGSYGGSSIDGSRGLFHEPLGHAGVRCGQ